MAKIEGTSGNDTKDGTSGADTILGRAGDDTLRGLEGNDSINGGSGLDRLEGGLDNDRLSGGKDDDTLFGDEGNDTLIGGTGTDKLDGEEGDDTLRARSGPDTLEGRQGNDLLEGGSGNDILRGGNDNDRLRGGPGNDELLGGAGDDFLAGLSGEDVLSASSGNDILDGGSGDDDLDGSIGNDTLGGGEGNDAIDGGEGTDTAIYLGAFDDFAFSVDGDEVVIEDTEPGLPAPGNDEGTDTLTDVERLQFSDRTTNADGSNSFPVVDADKTLNVPQDSAPVVIGIDEPSDPDGDDLRVQVIGLPDPNFGTILDRTGEPVLLADKPVIEELLRFTFVPAEGVFGAAGSFVYRVDDFHQGIATQTISFVIQQPDPGVIELGALSGKNGFTLEGSLEDDQLGSCVAGGQDVDGDGLDDILLGARMPTGEPQTGKAYVVFGDETPVAKRIVDTSDDYTLIGRGEKDRAGIACAISADSDGDELPDLLIGARGLGSEPDLPAGEAFFVRGAAIDRSATVNLATMTGTAGFRVQGDHSEDFAGSAVADAGDFNDDGLTDLILGASGVDAANAEERGEVYILFGKEGLDEHELNLAQIDQANGLRLLGAARRDAVGSTVSGAGDVNGDGIDDVIVGTPYADPGGTRTGQSFVVFGSAEPSEDGVLSLSDIDGTNGFTIDGYGGDNEEEPVEMRSGFDVSGAGDVNGDGFDDVIVGAPGLSDFGDSMGGAFVIYGGPEFNASIQLGALQPEQGFVIRGESSLDLAGTSVSSAGDFNNDGFDDLLIGAPAAEPHGAGSGAAYVVFGSENGPDGGAVELFTLDGSNGVVLPGPEKAHAGTHVAAAGDVNGDGFADVIVGASGASPKGRPLAGEVYVVFGRASDASVHTLSSPSPMPISQAGMSPAALSAALPAVLMVFVTVARIAAGARKLRRRKAREREQR